MILDPRSREILMKKAYGRQLLQPHHIFRLLQWSVKKRKGISIIRLGDKMAKLLAKEELSSLKRESPFLGISYPPSPQLLQDLSRSVRQATVVGVTYFPIRARQLQKFMKTTGWIPRFITDSFINDLMYDQGYLHHLLRSSRVALVGRSAEAAAQQLKKMNLPVSVVVSLGHYDRLPQAFAQLERTKNQWDLALVGASVPGRILCVDLTKRLNKTSFEIGHMMDALANPNEWNQHHDRKKFKVRWMRKLAHRKLEICP
ncbi:GT-D fold domain-containing glycosyltransferase [Ammoniphilus sp. 3BR4]|uniref:GT-D fold domain-containing protein n=1 Tax=Ammoniphilus sp. 3BR4 TaxID=3158265 RepID=UPI0034669C1A